MKALIVEDSPVMCSVFKNCLGKLRFAGIKEVPDLARAQSELSSANGGYNLLITDWKLDGIDGLALVKAVRADPQFKAMKIVVVTSLAEQEKVVQLVRAGANAVILRPFTPEVFLNRLQATLNAKE